MSDLTNNIMKNDEFINELVSDHNKFDVYIYTPMDEALKIIEERQLDKELNKRIESLLIKIPKVMEGKPKVVLFRNVTSPNYETKWFNDVVTTLEEKLEPLFLEYTKDKFTNRNECKFALGKLVLYKGRNIKGEPIFEAENIIDMNSSNCKPISSIKTLWDQPLVDFHHEIFLEHFPHYQNNIYDFSDWVNENGQTAKEYYKLFFLLFIKHGILLENYILKSKEFSFIKEIILPAFIEVSEKIGVKPLIVALEPTELEEGRFWQSHSPKIKEHLKKKRDNV